MTRHERASRWKPTEAEREALNDYMGPPLGPPEHHERIKANRERALTGYLNAVGPLIAARALREAAAQADADFLKGSIDGQTAALIAGRLRRRADEIEREASP